MNKPNFVPEKGFYYHYKHNLDGVVNNYAYELMGVGCHTEDDCRLQDEHLAVYRPLYSTASVYKFGQLFDIRPLSMWTGMVTVGGKIIPRFKKITDQKVISELKKIRDQMYGHRDNDHEPDIRL